MADEETKQNDQAKQEQPEAQAKQEKPEAQAEPDNNKGQLMQWIIMAGVIMALAVVGFFLGGKMGHIPKPQKPVFPTENTGSAQSELLTDNPAKASSEGWYYDLEPVATNLSDPGSTRYVRAVLTLEISPEVDKAKGTQFLDERKPVIANILNIYFAGLTIEDINSDKDMKRIQYELLETFNDTLYKGSKPLIKQVLFREFGLQ
jgi:flagellar basal body-associated protein FliL